MGHFESQNSKLLNLTTKTIIKQCKYISKTRKKLTLLMIHAQVHDGNNGVMTLIFTERILVNITNSSK